MQLNEFQKNRKLVRAYKEIQSSPVWEAVLSVLHNEHPVRGDIDINSPQEKSSAIAWRAAGYEKALRVLESLKEPPKKTLNQVQSRYGAK